MSSWRMYTICMTFFAKKSRCRQPVQCRSPAHMCHELMIWYMCYEYCIYVSLWNKHNSVKSIMVCCSTDRLYICVTNSWISYICVTMEQTSFNQQNHSVLFTDRLYICVTNSWYHTCVMNIVYMCHYGTNIVQSHESQCAVLYCCTFTYVSRTHGYCIHVSLWNKPLSVKSIIVCCLVLLYNNTKQHTMNSSILDLNQWSSSPGLFCHILLKRDQSERELFSSLIRLILQLVSYSTAHCNTLQPYVNAASFIWRVTYVTR